MSENFISNSMDVKTVYFILQCFIFIYFTLLKCRTFILGLGTDESTMIDYIDKKIIDTSS